MMYNVSMKKFLKKNELAMFIATVIIGLIMFGVGLGMYLTSDITNENLVEHAATISEIVEVKDKDIVTEIYANVKYEIDGIEYSGKLNYYLSSMKVGDVVGIYYDMNDPATFVFRSQTNWFPILLFSFGILLIFIAYPACKFSEWKYNMRMRKFKKYGYVEERD